MCVLSMDVVFNPTLVENVQIQSDHNSYEEKTLNTRGDAGLH